MTASARFVEARTRAERALLVEPGTGHEDVHSTTVAPEWGTPPEDFDCGVPEIPEAAVMAMLDVRVGPAREMDVASRWIDPVDAENLLHAALPYLLPGMFED